MGISRNSDSVIPAKAGIQQDKHSASAWLLPIYRLYNHGLPIAGARTPVLSRYAGITQPTGFRPSPE
jgi:hypothetical protein